MKTGLNTEIYDLLQEHLKQFLEAGKEVALSNHIFIFRAYAKQVVNREQGSVEQTPANKGPIRSVPESADSPNDIDITDDFPFVTSATAEREIDIITEPCRKRNMPPPPELRNASRKIREVKVAHQVETK